MCVLILPQIHWCLVCYCDFDEQSKLSLRFIKIPLLHRSISEAATLDIETGPCCRLYVLLFDVILHDLFVHIRGYTKHIVLYSRVVPPVCFFSAV